jgi:acid phosphatase (class A)
MKKLSYPLLAFLLVFSLSVQARDATPVSRYFDPATVDFKDLLPDPPANHSSTTKQEIDLILQKQTTWTYAERKRIRREVNLNVYLFDTVLGSWFAADNVPATAALFQKVDDTVRPVIDSAKKYWHRPRPFLLDSRIHPPIAIIDDDVQPPFDLSKSPAYPSGHSTVGDLDGLILAELAPDLKDALLARGEQIGDDRVIAGVHYPSDVKAGHTLAHALFRKLMARAAFQADLAKAKAEIAAERAK